MKRDVENIKRILRKMIKSMPDVVEENRDMFRSNKSNRRITLRVRRNEVTVEPLPYYYTSKAEVKEEEYELKDAIESYLKYGIKSPRLYFEEKVEKGKNLLYCIIEAAKIEIKFIPKWNELLNGVNRMVHTEYKNAEKRRNDKMLYILDSLRNITMQAETYCKKLGYDI